MSTPYLALIQLDMSRIGLPIFIVVGNISSFIGLLVFCQKTPRKNSCIVFLIGYMISNLVYLNFTVLSVVLSTYGFDFSIKSLSLCRLRMYISYVFSIIPTYLLVMASFDRMCISSTHARIRSIANRRLSIFLMIIIILFWSLFHLHSIFTSEFQSITSTKISCGTQSGTMSTMITYYSLICGGIIPLGLMTTFGARTWINVRRANRMNYHRREFRVISLVIVQIGIYLCLRLPISLYFIYQEATKSYFKTTDRILTDRFIFFIVVFSQFVQISISPMVNLTSPSFRSEFRRIIYKWSKNTIFQSEHERMRKTVLQIHPMNVK